jgi:mRNA interferase MazF
MKINQYEIWLADLNPRKGKEPGKIKPVLIVQTNLLNSISHPSTIVCPLTTNIHLKSEILRVHLKKGIANTEKNYDIMIDQIRPIANERLLKKIGEIPKSIAEKVKENIQIILEN